MKKVGEHVTIDFLGVKKEYSPDFYNNVIYKIAKKAGVKFLAYRCTLNSKEIKIEKKINIIDE